MTYTINRNFVAEMKNEVRDIPRSQIYAALFFSSFFLETKTPERFCHFFPPRPMGYSRTNSAGEIVWRVLPRRDAYRTGVAVASCPVFPQLFVFVFVFSFLFFVFCF